MSAEHTPGPWAWEEGQPNITKSWNGKDHQVACVDYRKLAWHEDSNCAGRESGANARLIAAAPELLDAVALARAQIKEDRDALAQCHTDPFGYVDKLGAAALSEYDETLSLIDAAIAKATGATL